VYLDLQVVDGPDRVRDAGGYRQRQEYLGERLRCKAHRLHLRLEPAAHAPGVHAESAHVVLRLAHALLKLPCVGHDADADCSENRHQSLPSSSSVATATSPTSTRALRTAPAHALRSSAAISGSASSISAANASASACCARTVARNAVASASAALACL